MSKTDKTQTVAAEALSSAGLTRRSAVMATAATLAAVKAAFPGGAHAAGAGPETAKARLGFIALTDSAAVIIAKERGLFAKHGMPDVEVLKQASWGATRDNLVLGSERGGIDGAHILSPMPYLMTTGAITGGAPTPRPVASTPRPTSRPSSSRRPRWWPT